MGTARAHGTAEQPEGGGGDSATSRTQRAFLVGSNDFVNNCYLVPFSVAIVFDILYVFVFLTIYIASAIMCVSPNCHLSEN